FLFSLIVIFGFFFCSFLALSFFPVSAITTSYVFLEPVYEEMNIIQSFFLYYLKLIYLSTNQMYISSVT
ncbi:MAG TPA: hypothetical protein PLQ28_09435, partial [Flexilinea sp.]|nr:hypothetical protein [Flexilinea sp.]